MALKAMGGRLVSDKQNKFIDSNGPEMCKTSPESTKALSESHSNSNAISHSHSHSNSNSVSSSISSAMPSTFHQSAQSKRNSSSLTQDSSRWAVFISGNGSNLQSLFDADPKISVVTVVSNKPEARGVARAEQAGVPVILHSKNASWSELSAQLKSLQIQFIFLLGFMKIIPESFIVDWKDKILNLHPSLLPHYKGLRALERSYEEQAAMGVTIHWVTPELDDGPILLQKEVFAPGQYKSLSLEQVKAEIHRTENEMVVEAVRRIQQC